MGWDPYRTPATRAIQVGGGNSLYQLISPWTKWPPPWQTTISNAVSWMKMIEFLFVPKSPIENKPELVQVMAWRRTGDKPLPEPLLGGRRNSSALAMELRLSCTNPSIWCIFDMCVYSVYILCWWHLNKQQQLLLLLLHNGNVCKWNPITLIQSAWCKNMKNVGVTRYLPRVCIQMKAGVDSCSFQMKTFAGHFPQKNGTIRSDDYT